MKGTPKHAAPWNLPCAYGALELQIKHVDEFLESSNFQHQEISLEVIILGKTPGRVLY